MVFVSRFAVSDKKEKDKEGEKVRETLEASFVQEPGPKHCPDHKMATMNGCRESSYKQLRERKGSKDSFKELKYLDGSNS